MTSLQGLFELGRARYQHGTKSISTLSFDMTMRALTIVEYVHSCGLSLIFIRRQSDGSLSLASSPAEASDDSDGEDGDSKATETQDGLRNRTESVKDGRPATKVAKTTRDPLKWFGVLAPQSLRTSQAHFKKGTAHSSFRADRCGLQRYTRAQQSRRWCHSSKFYRKSTYASCMLSCVVQRESNVYSRVCKMLGVAPSVRSLLGQCDFNFTAWG